MKRGIVLQVNASDVVVLTPDGQFCRLRRDPNRAYVVGEEIRFFPDKPRHRVKPAGALWLAAMAACLALVVVGGLLWMTAQPVMAYVTLDINPSVEMSIDERYRVIDLAGLNPDGERLVAELPHWKDRDLAAVTAEVLHQARRAGYLTEGRAVIVTTIVAEDKESPQRAQTITRTVEHKVEAVAVRTGVTVRSLVATPALRAEARAKGVSTGRYLLAREQERERMAPNAHGGTETPRPREAEGQTEGQGRPPKGKKENLPASQAIGSRPFDSSAHDFQLGGRDPRKLDKPDSADARQKAGARDAVGEEAKTLRKSKKKEEMEEERRKREKDEEKRDEREGSGGKHKDSRTERPKRATEKKDNPSQKSHRRVESPSGKRP